VKRTERGEGLCRVGAACALPLLRPARPNARFCAEMRGKMNEFLTPKQHKAIHALLASRTIEEAASVADCHPASIRRWLKDEDFSAAHRQARKDALDAAIAALQGAAARAAHTLEDELDSDSSGIRVRAAISILDRAIKGQELFDVIQRLEDLEELLEKRKDSNR
jgi:hypothetical protein